MKQINCDYCESDLTVSEGITKYRLDLICTACQHVGGNVLDVYIYPPLDKDLHFCGLGCLNRYFEK